jgi:hypothetical protein
MKVFVTVLATIGVAAFFAGVIIAYITKVTCEAEEDFTRKFEE